MVKVAWWPWLIWSIDIIKGTTQTICRIIGKDNSRYLIYHNGGYFNTGCNVIIVCMTLLAGLDFGRPWFSFLLLQTMELVGYETYSYSVSSWYEWAFCLVSLLWAWRTLSNLSADIAETISTLHWNRTLAKSV